MQNPTLSLEGDVAATRRVIDAQSGPAILVGHSYGGAVITEAGNDPNVAALVYIAAFAPDKGESVNTLIADPPPGAPVPPILPPQDGFLFLDREKFHASFAADVRADEAAFMADSQVPWGVDALGGTISEPAWRSKPSWYLITTEDRMIPPPAQRAMSARAGSTVSRSRGQPLDLRLAASSRGRTDQNGCLGLRSAASQRSDRLEQGGAGCLATAAPFSAEPAMLMVLGVALALLAAGRAGLPTALDLRPRGLRLVFRLPADHAAGRDANVGAVQAEANAPPHLSDVFLGEVGVHADRAAASAVVALGDASGERLAVDLARPRVSGE